MKLVNRSGWGALKPKGSLSTNITPNGGGVAIHYVGGKGKLTPSSHKKCANIVKSIQTGHLNNKAEGYIDIAYNFLVCTHGYVYEGRGLHRRSGANGTTAGNQFYYAVCALVNEADDISPELIQGLKDICHYLRTKGKAGNKVIGHKNLISTSCPGTKLSKYVSKGTFKKGGNNSTNSYPGKYIQKGSRGSLVKKVQSQLLKKGMRLPRWGVDGVFGDETLKAVKTFQGNHNLVKDGIVGPKTWGKLFK